MKCPHCAVDFHDVWETEHISRFTKPTGWFSRIAKCSSCKGYIIGLGHLDPDNQLQQYFIDTIDWQQVYPLGSNRGPVSEYVPKEISDDYNEAARVLPISPKSSAALSRRCLQNVLHANGYADKNLFKEIDKLLNEPDPRKAIPDSLRMTVDGIRHFGNFSAHPVTDITSLQIIDVEPHEAEWCLDILDEVFQHFYVKPAQAIARKVALDAKLVAAGKNPSK